MALQIILFGVYEVFYAKNFTEFVVVWIPNKISSVQTWND